MVFEALGKGPKTIPEIEAWGQFNGPHKRRRQQTVCRCLHRLIEHGLAEKTSRWRLSDQSGWRCGIYRLTRVGELIWRSG